MGLIGPEQWKHICLKCYHMAMFLAAEVRRPEFEQMQGKELIDELISLEESVSSLCHIGLPGKITV